MSQPVGFGVIGANSFVANAAVLPAILAARNATLIATASRSAAVPDRWASCQVADYADVIDHPDVEAVYIPLPNGMHQAWTERAAASGKHVLCEKPLAPDAATARAMAATCTGANVVLAEAWMTPFDRRWDATLQLAREGLIGDVTRQHHRFTFTIDHDQSDNYRWDVSQGGGALLDVGIYCIGTAVELWGAGCTVDEVASVPATSGVDATTIAELRWPGDRTAHIRCSFVEEEIQRAEFVGSTGRLILGHGAYTGGGDRDHIITRTHTDPSVEMQPATISARLGPATPGPDTAGSDAAGRETSRRAESDRVDVAMIRQPQRMGPPGHHLLSCDHGIEPGDPYQAMVEAFSDAVRGTAPWPRPVERSIELLDIIERIMQVAHAS